MIVVAIDPGPELSAFVRYDTTDKRVLEAGKPTNREMLSYVYGALPSVDALAVEMLACYGMAVGATVFDTCVWVGRYVEAWGGDATLVYRREVKLHLCGSMRAKDANVRAALLDRFGPPGTKRQPGVTYGLAGDMWQALAVAVTYADTRHESISGRVPHSKSTGARRPVLDGSRAL